MCHFHLKAISLNPYLVTLRDGGDHEIRINSLMENSCGLLSNFLWKHTMNKVILLIKFRTLFQIWKYFGYNLFGSIIRIM